MIIYQCDYCGKQSISESGELPHGWFNMGYVSNRHEYACSKDCMVAIDNIRQPDKKYIRLATYDIPTIKYELVLLLSNNHTVALPNAIVGVPFDRKSVRYYRDLMNDPKCYRAQIRKVVL